MKLHNFLLSRSNLPKLYATPKTSILHRPVEISGLNLPPNCEVTLKSSLVCAENRFNFVSINKYKTHPDGSFHTNSSETLPVSDYTGVHSSGPIWSMRPQTGSRLRLWMKNISAPLQYNFSLLDSNNTSLGEASLTKMLLTKDVQRVGISKGNIQGALFVPLRPIQGKRKAVITIYGGAMGGRAPEDTAALLAQEGVVAFALAFYGAKGQQEIYHDINIEQLEEAVDFILGLDMVEDRRVGLYGVSKGADICLAMASFLGPKIGGTIAVNNTFASLPGKTVYKDKVIKATRFIHNWKEDKLFQFEGGLEAYFRDKDRQIAVENCSGPVLAIVGLDDKFATLLKAKAAQERARLAGKLDFKIITYAGLGHLLDAPNSPVCVEGKNPLVDQVIQYGGVLQQHSLAQIASWQQVVKFFNNF